MPRKNSRVRRRNSLGYRHLDPDQPWMPSYVWLGLDQIVIPDGKCTLFRQKDRYDTEKKAHEAKRRINAQRRDFPESRKIKRVYPCPDPECGGYHLTSREEFDEAQSKALFEQRQNQEEAS